MAPRQPDFLRAFDRHFGPTTTKSPHSPWPRVTSQPRAFAKRAIGEVAYDGL
jgi:hypothetical protein